MQERIDELLQRKMDRRDFLKHIGVGMLALVGLGAAMKALSPNVRQESTNVVGNADYYGRGAYGGSRQSIGK